MSKYIIQFSDWIWSIPLLTLLIGGGLFFLLYSRLAPFAYLRFTLLTLLFRKKANSPGQISGYEALSTALASTVGMGNVSGVAVAITTGGPGAIFWMWITAFLGMTTNFFTCALACMYRGKDSQGEIQGGPMYVIVEGLGKKWKPMASLFAVCCLLGMLPIFQANQLTQAIRDIVLVPAGITGETWSWQSYSIQSSDFFTGLMFVSLTSLVLFGGIQRIGKWAGKMVPIMVLLYFCIVSYILITHIQDIPDYLKLIFSNAFTGENFHPQGEPVFGGILGGLIILGARRASFSNEAGIGSVPMAMGASKTNEPIEEGLIGMLSPAIDTLIVCTCTAMAILVTGAWKLSDSNGVSLTAYAFSLAIPHLGSYLLMLCVFFFGISSLFSYGYYGVKSMSFLIGVSKSHWYNYFYIGTIMIGATSSLKTMMSFLDSVYALMAIPTMVSGVLLAPHVMRAFHQYKKDKIK